MIVNSDQASRPLKEIKKDYPQFVNQRMQLMISKSHTVMEICIMKSIMNIIGRLLTEYRTILLTQTVVSIKIRKELKESAL